MWLCGLYVAHSLTALSAAAEPKVEKKEGRKREMDASKGGKESIKNIYKTFIYILWTMFVK